MGTCLQLTTPRCFLLPALLPALDHAACCLLSADRSAGHPRLRRPHLLLPHHVCADGRADLHRVWRDAGHQGAIGSFSQQWSNAVPRQLVCKQHGAAWPVVGQLGQSCNLAGSGEAGGYGHSTKGHSAVRPPSCAAVESTGQRLARPACLPIPAVTPALLHWPCVACRSSPGLQ